MIKNEPQGSSIILRWVLLALFFCGVYCHADTAGVDPYQTVQSFLSSPSDVTRDEVIEMTRSIFTKPYATYSPEIYAPGTQDTDDLSIQYLSQIFGNVPGVLDGTSSLLSHMFYAYNYGVFAVVGMVIAYLVVSSTLNTGAQGQFMGRKVQNPYWIWIRSFTGVSILIPSYNGYSLIQVVLMWVAIQGVNLTNAIWSEVQNVVYTTNSILSYVKLVDADANTSIAGVTPLDQANMKASDRCLYSSTSSTPGCQAKGDFFITTINDATTLSQALLGFQGCLSYNLQILEDQYQACMQAVGNFDQKSCYPPKRELLYSINYNAYTISYTRSDVTGGNFLNCGTVSMTPTCSSSTGCPDYNMQYDQNTFSEMLDLFYAMETPGDQIFQYYRQCDDTTDNNACYQPPTSTTKETDANCVIHNGSDVMVNASCQITLATVNGIQNFVNTLITNQTNTSNASVGPTTSAAGTGIDDPLGFQPGGWIMAGNAYGTMVYYGGAQANSALPSMNGFSWSMTGQGLPVSYQNTINYIRPANSSSTPGTGSSQSQVLGPDSTLQTSLLDWSGQVSSNEITTASNEQTNNSGSENVLTGYPVTACLSGDSFYKDGQQIFCNTAMGGSETSVQGDPFKSAGGVDAQGCGKNDGSLRYLACLVNYNIGLKNGDALDGFPFAVPPYSPSSSNTTGWQQFMNGMNDWFSGDMIAGAYLPDYGSIINGYFGSVQRGWVIASFGGTSVREIVDPINRMRTFGINLIQASVNYVGDLISNTMDFLMKLIMSLYAGFVLSMTIVLMTLELISAYIVSALDAIMTYIKDVAMPLAMAVPVFGPALEVFLWGIFYLLKGIAAIFKETIVGLSVIVTTFLSIVPLLSQLAFLSVTKFLSFYLAFAIPALMLGGYLAGYLALLPYLVFLTTIVGWLLLLLEGMVAAPLIALGITYPYGHDFFGRAEQLTTLFLGVFVRPACILIGFVFSIMLASLSLFLLNLVFFSVIINTLDATFSSPFLSIELANYYQGGETGSNPYNGFVGSGGIFDLTLYVGVMLFYAYTAGSVLIQCFSLTYTIPYQITRWIDPRGAESPDEVRGAMDEIKQSFVGELVGGMASAITSLFSLQAGFMNMTQTASVGSGRIEFSKSFKENPGASSSTTVE